MAAPHTISMPAGADTGLAAAAVVMPVRGVAALLAALAVLALFTLSPLMLDHLGIHYETLGGNGLEKLHPATYLASLALLLFLAAQPSLLPALSVLGRRHWGTLVLGAGLGVAAFQVFRTDGLPIAALIDTFVLTAFLFVLLAHLAQPTRRRLEGLLHLLLALNALLGLAELASGLRLTPLVAAGIELTSDWRSSALLGHPLANAVVSGVYVLILALGGGRALAAPVKALAIALQLAAMPAFGGRVATALVLLVLGMLLVRAVLRFAGGARMSPLHFALLALAVPAGAGLLWFAAEIGLFERFLERFLNDEGSAGTRLSMLRLFDWVPLRDILLGPDPEWISSLQRVEGIEFGIESFEIALVFYYGAVVALILCIGIACFCVDVWRNAAPSGLVVLVYFLAVASTSLSIAGKTTTFAMAVSLIMLLLPRERAGAGAKGRA